MMCFPFKIRLIRINRPPRVFIRCLYECLTRSLSRGLGNVLIIFVRIDVKFHAPPAFGCVSADCVNEWNLAVD